MNIKDNILKFHKMNYKKKLKQVNACWHRPLYSHIYSFNHCSLCIPYNGYFLRLSILWNFKDKKNRQILQSQKIYISIHIGIGRYNAIAEIENAEYNLIPIRDRIGKISTCRKYPLYSTTWETHVRRVCPNYKELC